MLNSFASSQKLIVSISPDRIPIGRASCSDRDGQICPRHEYTHIRQVPLWVVSNARTLDRRQHETQE